MAVNNEYYTLINQLQNLSNDAKKLTDGERDIIERTIILVEQMLEQDLLCQRLTAITASKTERDELITRLDAKIQEYRQIAETWKNGVNSSFIPYESKELERITRCISKLQKLRESIINCDYKKETENFVNEEMKKTSHELAEILATCCYVLAVGYNSTPSLKGKNAIVNPGGIGRSPKAEYYFKESEGFDIQRIVTNYLSKEAIDLLYYLFAHRDELDKILKAYDIDITLRDKEKDLEQGQANNELVSFCLAHTDGVMQLKEFFASINHFRSGELGVEWNYAKLIAANNRRIHDLSKNPLSKIINARDIKTIETRTKQLQQDHYSLISIFGQDIDKYLELIKDSRSGVEAVESLSGKMVDINALQQDIAAKEKERASVVASMDPVVRDVLEHNTWWLYEIVWEYIRTGRHYIIDGLNDYGKTYRISEDGGFTTRLIAIHVLKTIVDTYNLPAEQIEQLISTDAQIRVEELVEKFTEIVQTRDQAMAYRVEDAMSESFENFPSMKM